MYSVHVKYVTATEARQNWFRLLDEAAGGEVIAIRRHSKKLILKLEEDEGPIPGYDQLIRARDADAADAWSWEWTPSGELRPKDP
jgi:hypothetical protein